MTLPRITETQLAWLAETADGWRSEDIWLVPDAQGGLVAKRARDLAPGEEARALAVVPATEAPRATAAPQLGFSTDGGSTWQPIDTLGTDPCDSFFLTASAVRKFLIPYYEAHRLLDADAIARLRRTDFHDVVGVAHYPPSIARQVDCAGELVSEAVPEGSWAVLVRRADGRGEPALQPMTLGAYAESLD